MLHAERPDLVYGAGVAGSALEGTELGVLFACVICKEQHLEQVVRRSDTCLLL